MMERGNSEGGIQNMQRAHFMITGSLSVCFAFGLHADTIHVPADQPTIAEALAASADGDTIAIAAGTYFEAELLPSTGDLLIIGETDALGRPLVTIDASNTSVNVTIGFGVVGSEGTTVENIIFTGSTGNALWIYHYSPTIRNCVFLENNAVASGVAVWSMDSEAIFENCRFEKNVGDPGAIFLSRGVDKGEPGPTLRNCVFCENQTGVNLIEGIWTDGGGNEFHTDCAALCPNDLNNDGVMDGADLSLLLGYWGPCADPLDCPYDISGDGTVGGADLTLLLGSWGICP